MNPWDTLPNGKRIDGVLEFVRNNPALVGGSQLRCEIWGPQWHEVWKMAFSDAWLTTQHKSIVASWSAVLHTKQELARDAICALLAYDYAGELYDAELDVVELAAHEEDPAAVLLLPILRVMKDIKEKP